MSAQQAFARRAPDRAVNAVPNAVEDALQAIAASMPSSRATVDRSNNPSGEWFIDLVEGDFAIQVAWRADAGFGLFTSEEGYGDRPNEVYRQVKKLALRLEQLHRQWQGSQALKPVKLAQLRQLLALQQTELAVMLDCKQSAVSRVENRGDNLIGTLQRHVQAMGGRLELRAHFADLDVSLELPAAEMEPV